MTKKIPYVSSRPDQHGKVRHRFRKNGFTTYITEEKGSAEFRAVYQQLLEGCKKPVVKRTLPKGTMGWLIEHYLASSRHAGKAEGTRNTLRNELDWLKRVAGELPLSSFRGKHVEALMDKKEGPAAKNKVRKNMSMLFNYAIRLEVATVNPVKGSDRVKNPTTGFHTWTEAQIERFLQHHGAGTKARLALLLALNTGAGRQDLSRMGWQNVSENRIAYRRGKTGVEADLPILPELAEELANVPKGQLLFFTHSGGKPYAVASFGNWFKDQAVAAGIDVRSAGIHGLRKAGATRLAENQATEWEVAAYLAHKSPRMSAVYVQQANRAKLSTSAFARMSGAKDEQKLSNLSGTLDKASSKKE